MTAAQFRTLVAEQGGQAVHATALRAAILRRGIGDWADDPVPASPLPGRLRDGLAAAGVTPITSRVLRAPRSADGSHKLVLELADGETVETVVMPTRHGASVCLSTQVGCPVACPFCATGLDGVRRNLAAHEILEQFALARRLAPVNRVVVMGMGEPLLNETALKSALRVLIEEVPVPPGRITVSTVGFPERVRRLLATGPRCALAISLHAVDPETRARLVPAMRDVDVAEVIAAAHEYAVATGGRVQFEYVVLPGVNDSLDDVERLADALQGVHGYVNFIAWNPVAELPFQRPDAEHVKAMVRRARARGLLATARTSVGQDVDAACGQLRRQSTLQG